MLLHEGSYKPKSKCNPSAGSAITKQGTVLKHLNRVGRASAGNRVPHEPQASQAMGQVQGPSMEASQRQQKTGLKTKLQYTYQGSIQKEKLLTVWAEVHS